ncbi:MAG: DNA-processing protein DprA [Treponema sp.]|nr:DNA-processing protein DprA [Treponema sp.]
MNENLGLIVSLLPGVRVTEKIQLLLSIKNEEDLFLQTKSGIEEILGRRLQNFWDISEINDKAGRIDTMCRMRSVKWVSWPNEDYPPLLREIYDPPSVLYYRGVLPNPEKPLLAMVGTRKPSRDACEQAYKIAANAARAGISVISGLALGIDAMSHRGSLIANVPGYAVLGSGIDEVYPSANRSLAKRIINSGGALISEYPPGFPPSKWSFPARNRIISGLSRSVLIVEAPEKSGALITASFALEHGKELWVASQGIQDGPYDRGGTKKLANDGAEIIYSACDIIEKWNLNNVNDDGKNYKGDNNDNTAAINSREGLVSSMADLLKIEI